jgi:hypothetical protein
MKKISDKKKGELMGKDARIQDEGLARIERWIGCRGCDFCDAENFGTPDQCKGSGYVPPAYQSPGTMGCRNRHYSAHPETVREGKEL